MVLYTVTYKGGQAVHSNNNIDSLLMQARNLKKALQRKEERTRERAAVPKAANQRPRPPQHFLMIPMQRDMTPTIRIIAR